MLEELDPMNGLGPIKGETLIRRTIIAVAAAADRHVRKGCAADLVVAQRVRAVQAVELAVQTGFILFSFK